MIAILFAGFIILGIVLVAEYLGRKGIMHGEAPRKMVHMLGGLFIASWPFFMGFRTIALLSLAAAVVMLVVRYFKLFGSLHNVDRKSAGDVLFAAGIGLTALVTTNKWIFSAAILHLAVADGLAALIGTRVKSKVLIHIGGERRTVAGTLAFFISSALILCWLTLAVHTGLRAVAIYIPWLAFQATAIEFISIWGADNILVPLYLAAILNSLR